MNMISLILAAKTVSATVGCVFLLLLFTFCFLCTHVIKLAFLGWKSSKPSSPPPPPPEKEKTPTPPEPIYYIVERKQRRSKASYGEPKEIRFK